MTSSMLTIWKLQLLVDLELVLDAYLRFENQKPEVQPATAVFAVDKGY